MKIRIEVEIGDKIVCNEKVTPDRTFGMHTSPNHYVNEMQRAIWEQMREAIEKANEEFGAAYDAKYSVDRPWDVYLPKMTLEDIKL